MSNNGFLIIQVCGECDCVTVWIIIQLYIFILLFSHLWSIIQSFSLTHSSLYITFSLNHSFISLIYYHLFSHITSYSSLILCRLFMTVIMWTMYHSTKWIHPSQSIQNQLSNLIYSLSIRYVFLVTADGTHGIWSSSLFSVLVKASTDPGLYNELYLANDTEHIIRAIAHVAVKIQIV